MKDEEINRLLWGAFLLGGRVAAVQRGKDLSLEEIGKIAGTARAIAENETTLDDPGELAAKFGDRAWLGHKLGTLTIRSNRDLAKRVYAGYGIVNEEPG